MPDHSFAEKIYDGPEADAALIKLALDQEGIQAFVDIGGPLSRHMHGVIFVLDPNHVERARAVVDRFLSGEPAGDAPAEASWRCGTCHELIEAPFLRCWKCGATKP